MPSRRKPRAAVRRYELLEVQLPLPGVGLRAGKDQFLLDVTGPGEPSGSPVEVSGGATSPCG